LDLHNSYQNQKYRAGLRLLPRLLNIFKRLEFEEKFAKPNNGKVEKAESATN
jgi:hypothetical protein